MDKNNNSNSYNVILYGNKKMNYTITGINLTNNTIENNKMNKDIKEFICISFYDIQKDNIKPCCLGM